LVTQGFRFTNCKGSNTEETSSEPLEYLKPATEAVMDMKCSLLHVFLWVRLV